MEMAMGMTNDPTTMTIGLSQYRILVTVAYEIGEIDTYEAIKRLFNAGFRGRMLDPTYRPPRPPHP